MLLLYWRRFRAMSERAAKMAAMTSRKSVQVALTGSGATAVRAVAVDTSALTQSDEDNKEVSDTDSEQPVFTQYQKIQVMTTEAANSQLHCSSASRDSQRPSKTPPDNCNTASRSRARQQTGSSATLEWAERACAVRQFSDLVCSGLFIRKPLRNFRQKRERKATKHSPSSGQCSSQISCSCVITLFLHGQRTLEPIAYKYIG